MARTGDNALVPLLGAYGGNPTFAADLTEVANNAAQAFGTSVDTYTNLPTTKNWPGRLMPARDTGAVYEWTGAGWVFLAQPATGWTTLSLASGWAPQGTPPYAPLRSRLNPAGDIQVQGQILPKSGYASTDVFATLPVGQRPSVRIEVPVVGNSAATRVLGGVIIDTNGNMSLNPANLGAFNINATIPRV